MPYGMEAVEQSSVVRALKRTPKGSLSYSPKWDKSSEAERIVSLQLFIMISTCCLQLIPHRNSSQSLPLPHHFPPTPLPTSLKGHGGSLYRLQTPLQLVKKKASKDALPQPIHIPLPLILNPVNCTPCPILHYPTITQSHLLQSQH